MLFEELTIDMQDRLIEEYRQQQTQDFWWFFDEEIKYSYQEIAKMLGCKLDYEYSLCSCSWTELIGIDDDVRELSGSRAIAYIYRHWIEPHQPAKIYRKGDKTRTSAIKHDYFDLTGMWCDQPVMMAWKDFVDEMRHDITLDVADYIDRLEHHMTKLVVDEAEYNDSDDGIREYLEQFDYDEDGNQVA
jgi:hypothetical protein